MSEPAADTKAVTLVKFIMRQAIDGVGPLEGSVKLAEQYEKDPSYRTTEERVEGLIRWEAGKNFGSGFLTGMGGLLTLPVAIPTALTTSWILQARMVGAIAKIYGQDPMNDRVQTLILLTLIGEKMKDVLKEFGVTVSTRLTIAAIEQIPGKLLIEINKQVGFRLITKAGQTGAINLMKVVPFLGGAVAGGVDAYYCKKVGAFASATFRPSRSEGKVA